MPKKKYKGRRNARKKTEFNSQPARCVFLSGYPDEVQLGLLRKIKDEFNLDISRFIEELSDIKYTPELICGSSVSQEMRALEKSIRASGRRATLSQAAFDNAFTKLANREAEIRKHVLSEILLPITKSKQLYAMLIGGSSKEDMIRVLKDRQQAKESSGKERDQHVDEWLSWLENTSQKDFKAEVDAVLDAYHDFCLMHKVPEISKEHVRLVSTNFKFAIDGEISNRAVITIVNPGNGQEGQITVPLAMSRDSRRRLKQYGACHSAEFTVTEDGRLVVAVAFKKKIEKPKEQSYRGVDIGITDALYTDDSGPVGTMSDIIDYYKKVVEPEFARRSKLLDKKHKLVSYIRKHKNLPVHAWKSIRSKIDRLEDMARRSNKANRLSNRYHSMLKKRVHDIVTEYIRRLKGDKTLVTALELLDINEFNASKKVNGSRSVFARGFLQQKLMDSLNWYGYAFVQVDPAYTSQACPHCGYVDPGNRNGKKFCCLCCGHNDDADHVGSQNIKARVFDDEITAVCEKNQYNKENRHKAIRMVYAGRNDKWKKSMMALA